MRVLSENSGERLKDPTTYKNHYAFVENLIANTGKVTGQNIKPPTKKAEIATPDIPNLLRLINNLEYLLKSLL